MSKWISVAEEKPLAYKTGEWDGNRSDLVLLRKGKNICVGVYYEGTLDGTEFSNFYSCDFRGEGYEVEPEYWMNIDE